MLSIPLGSKNSFPFYLSMLLGVFTVVLSTSVHAQTIKVEDALGETIVLKQPAQRIISLAPHITELVFAVGAGGNLVGVVSFSNYPEEALKIPQIGSYNKVSYESIAGLNPDLILAWKSGNGKEMIAHLKRLGFTVYVGEPKTLDSVATSMLTMGQLTGNEVQASKAYQSFKNKLSSLRSDYSHKQPVTTFYQVWNDPRLTINDDHLISDVIRLCGGSNIFADAMVLTPKVNVESVIRRDPEIIVASGMALERPEWLDEWRLMPTMKAVANEQLYFIPPDLLQRHSPRIIKGAKMMCEYIQKARDLSG